jgi:hypothetical protein
LKADNDNFDLDAPLRLAVAAVTKFPDGSMTASGLRRERDRGRLATWMIAGKEYTTISAIEDMIKLCRVPANDRTSGSGPNVVRMEKSLPARPTSSSMAESISPQAALRMKLNALTAA